MRKTIRFIACAVLLLAAPLTFCLFAFGIPAQYEDTFLGALRYKYEALENTPGNRIVIIGGSGVAFGQDSDLIESELDGYEVINFGMYAGLGTTVMLDLAEELVRDGDIVIVSPEQSEQTLSDYFDPEYMWQASDGRFDLLLQLDAGRLESVIGQLPYFAAQKFNFWFNGSTPDPEGVYSLAAFNDSWDIGYPHRDCNIMPGGYDPDMPITFDESLPDGAFISYVNGFAADCREKGVEVYYRFCPMNALAVTPEGYGRMERYCEELAEQLDCRIIGSIDDSVMDAGWFYDTNFHLNSAGAIVNSANLVQDIKSILGDRSPTEIDLPQMPAFADGLLTEGDDSDANCFLYEIADGAASVVGLTEEGRGRISLTVPTRYAGVPVTTVSSRCFAGNETVQQIVIQRNVKRIENGAFAGCSALRRLVMKNVSPQSCVVGSDLLEGTDCSIIVPDQCYSAYVTNYFWSAHSARIVPEQMPDLPDPDAPEVDLTPDVSGMSVVYHGNGGVRSNGEEILVLPMDNAHLRANTAQGTRYFHRDGYILLGWNTEPDGSGTAVGLGSRIEKSEELVLYAQWARESAVEDFIYEIAGDEIHITGYRGDGECCVVPNVIGGLPVSRICSGAFQNASFETLVLPPGLFAVERQAFINCAVYEIYLFDSLYYIYDESFAACENLKTLHINAATSPVYSGSYYDTFPDKYDWLLSMRDTQKIVLFSGSSARFGYDSSLIAEAFPEYQVANMGVYAYTNALPQYELILGLMQPGDILLSAPEFDAVSTQFCVNSSLDSHFWAMMESNYDAVSLLDLRNYSQVFDSLRAYLNVRISMEPRDYSVSASGYDDDGNRYTKPTYNCYGDLILERPNSQRDEAINWGVADYTVDAFPLQTVESLNRVYRMFIDKGITVYFTYTPRNIHAITETSTPQARQELHRYLQENLCVEVISDIEESLYSGIYFYLIDSHLTTEGARIRTQRVISDLRAVLAQ